MMPFLFGQPPSGMLYLFHNVERRKIRLYNEMFYNVSLQTHHFIFFKLFKSG